MKGIMSTKEALQFAIKSDLDLVEISPNASPPVCRILDFGKFKYQIKRRANEAKKKQKSTSLKEIKFRVNIGPGDFGTKLNKIKSFISQNDKVKVSLWFKGREIAHQNLAHKLFERILNELGDQAKIISSPKIEGKQMIMVLGHN